MSERLKIGLLLDSSEISLWEYTIVERLKDSDYASIELIILNDSSKVKRSLFSRIIKNWERLFFILYSKLDQKLFKFKPDAFEVKDISDLLNAIPVIKVKPNRIFRPLPG